jgi:hypothetical protein
MSLAAASTRDWRADCRVSHIAEQQDNLVAP